MAFEGLELFEDVVTEEHEREIVETLELWEWQASQSGRWKQDFGPKANFKKKQVKIPVPWSSLKVFYMSFLFLNA